VVDLADVLPQLKGADLESQLQTFDALLEHLPLPTCGITPESILAAQWCYSI
jgi:hypothetical protein